MKLYNVEVNQVVGWTTTPEYMTSVPQLTSINQVVGWTTTPKYMTLVPQLNQQIYL